MKYCVKCGNELVDEAVVCTKCGCAVPERKTNIGKEKSNLKSIAEIFMIIGTVLSAFAYLIPLAWTIPMTVSYHKKVKNGEKISTGFKVCSLLFVSMVAGILMLVDDDN